MVFLRRITLFISLVFLVACTVNPKQPPTPAIAISRATALPLSSALTSTVRATQTASLTSIPSVEPLKSPTQPIFQFTNPTLVVLAENLPGPDDLVLSPDSIIYLSDVVDGTVRQYGPDGSLKVFLSGLDEPEGMVFLPDGSLLIAEQGKNRIVRVDPVTKQRSTFLNLRNKTGQLGIDGIALALEGSSPARVIIPDSPNGTILQASLDGQTVSQIAQGFSRPTSVWIEPNGNLLVADENSGTLSRLHPNRNVEVLAKYATPDDVVEDPFGNIFVCSIGDGSIHLIRSGSNKDEILMGGFSSPQGLVLDNDGNLVVTDPGHHRLIKIIIHH
jgi:sugar lactone lactonase YvrE